MSKLDPALEQLARQQPHLVDEAGVTALIVEIDGLRKALAASVDNTARARRELAEQRTDTVEAGSTVVGYVGGTGHRQRTAT